MCCVITRERERERERDVCERKDDHNYVLQKRAQNAIKNVSTQINGKYNWTILLIFSLNFFKVKIANNPNLISNRFIRQVSQTASLIIWHPFIVVSNYLLLRKYSLWRKHFYLLRLSIFAHSCEVFLCVPHSPCSASGCGFHVLWQ